MEKMREGTPRIELNPGTGGPPASAGLPGGSNTIVVGVWMLQPGEDLVVGGGCARSFKGRLNLNSCGLILDLAEEKADSEPAWSSARSE